MKNIVERDGQEWIFDRTKCAPLEEGETIEQAKSKGCQIFRMVGNGVNIIYKSKETDGYIRDMSSVEKWNPSIKVNPYEKDQMVWAKNVKEWFDKALSNNLYVGLIQTTYPNIIATEAFTAAAEEMSSHRLARRGKKGKRDGSLDDWFRNNKNSFLSTYNKG